MDASSHRGAADSPPMRTRHVILAVAAGRGRGGPRDRAPPPPGGAAAPPPMRTRHVILAVAAGLALADASIVTLALPQLLQELGTTVEGVAAVLGVYTVVLAIALLPAERLQRRLGAPAVGAGGLALFALASAACGSMNDLTPLLVARGFQAVGGAAALVAAFALLEPSGAAGERGRRLWLGAAVLAAAVGPALGGALTQAF